MGGINLAELQQKVDRLLFNMAEQNRRAYQLFYDPVPKDVELPQLDENGNLTTIRIPNRAKIKAEVDGFVAESETKIKGWWDRTFYVDSNGDDNNPGTQDAPFKTLQKAIDSIPVGGAGKIRLNEGEYRIDQDIQVYNKVIEVEGFLTDINKVKIIQGKPNESGYTPAIRLRDSMIAFYYVSFETTQEEVNSNHYATSLLGRANDSGFGIIQLYVTNVSLYNGDLVSVSFGGGHIQLYITDTNVVKHGDGMLLRIENAAQTSVLSTYASTFKDSSGNTLSGSDVIAGIVKDSNGVPRNIISNLVL